jgi:RNA polymerase sigma-70 factor (ECF subfamily)
VNERTDAVAAASSDPGDVLMLAVQAGDRSALHRLVAMYNAKLYSFVVRIVGDRSSAEDVVQETWMSLFEKRETYQSTYKFSTWLFTIARRKALSELRRRSVRAIVRPFTFGSGSDAVEIEPPQATFTGPDSATDSVILMAMIERALATLAPHQREIVMLRDIEGFENEEIAEILQWTLKPGAIRKRVFDAREAFRRAMIAIGYTET